MILKRSKAWLFLKWEPRDLWVGVFWDRRRADYWCDGGHCIEDLHVYVCLVPCVVMHLIIAWKYKG